jgi:hypothetical protein
MPTTIFKAQEIVIRVISPNMMEHALEEIR